MGIAMLMLLFTATAAELRTSVLGCAGGSPVADDNPCLSTWLCPIMAYKTPVSLFGFFGQFLIAFPAAKEKQTQL